jgi:hypothetical protein
MNRQSLCPIHGLPSSPGAASPPPTEAQGADPKLSGLRSVFRAASILPVVLAVAVVLWGLAYKLSLYHAHQDHVGRTIVAKLWTGPPKAALRVNNARHSEWPAVQFQIQSFATDYPSHTGVEHLLSLVRVRSRSHSRLGMLRSPPAQLL